MLRACSDQRNLAVMASWQEKEGRRAAERRMEAHAGEKRAREELPVTMGPVVYWVEEDVQPDIKRARTEEGELYDPWIPTDEAIVVEERAEPSDPPPPIEFPEPPANTFASELMQASRAALTLIEIPDDDDDEPEIVVPRTPRANVRGFQMETVSILERGSLESFERNPARNRVNSCLAVYQPIWSSELWRWATNAKRYVRTCIMRCRLVSHLVLIFHFYSQNDTVTLPLNWTPRKKIGMYVGMFIRTVVESEVLERGGSDEEATSIMERVCSSAEEFLRFCTSLRIVVFHVRVPSLNNAFLTIFSF